MVRLLAILIWLTPSSVGFAQAQTSANGIKLLTKSKKEGMWLRWAPTNPTVWQLGNRYGYVVERFILRPNGDIENPLGEKLNNFPIKVYAAPELDKLSARIGEASIIKELVYGTNAQTTYQPNNPLSVMAHNREMENRFGVGLLVCDMSLAIAEAAGLFFNDATAKKGIKYIYRISIPYQNQSLSIEPGIAVVEFTEERPLSPPNGLNAQFDDHKVTLNWPTLLDRGIYSAYHVEKSEDGKTFHRLTKIPYVHMSTAPQSESAFFVDSLQQNSKTYYYRILGLTPFGETGLATQPISGEGKDNLSGLLILHEGKATPEKQASLRWEFPPEANNQLSGFQILKSNNPSQGYELATSNLLPANNREWKDDLNANNTYYVVVGIGKRGEERVRSFPYLVQMEDITPPVSPTGLSGTITEKGAAALAWSANTEKDLKGYRVFRANKLTDEFIEVTKIVLASPRFIDTVNINVLNKKIFYKIVAVDKNYNTSEYSSALTLVKPDIVAPTPPLFTKAEMSEGRIVLEWSNSISEDIARYSLFRTIKGDTTSNKLLEWAVKENKNQWEDPNVTLGRRYRYTLIAFDSAENKGVTHSREIYFETGVRPSVSSLKSTVDRENKTILLQWSNFEPSEKVILYRKENNASLTIYKTLEGDVNSFLDKGRDISINNTYTYKIQPVHKGGVRAQLSNELVVKF